MVKIDWRDQSLRTQRVANGPEYLTLCMDQLIIRVAYHFPPIFCHLTAFQESFCIEVLLIKVFGAYVRA